MKKNLSWWKKLGKKQQPKNLLDVDKLDKTTLQKDIDGSNVVLSGDILYSSDIYNTISLAANNDTSVKDLDKLKKLCSDYRTDYSIVDLVMLLTIPKSDNTDLFKLFSTTPELRIVYTESPLCTYVLLGSSIQGYRDLILNTKNQNNSVLNTIKYVLYLNCYSWPFSQLISIGVMDDYFIEPGVDCFWDDNDIEIDIDEAELDDNINTRIAHSVIYDLKSLDIQYVDDSYEEKHIPIYNLPNIYEIYDKSLRKLKFHIYDVIKVFGFNYVLPDSQIRYTTVYDIIYRYGYKSPKLMENRIIYGLTSKDPFVSMIFGGYPSDVDMILTPVCLRVDDMVEVDEVLDKKIIEEDISEEGDSTIIIGDDEELLSGDMPIPKFDVDRYRSTRLIEEEESESKKYDV